MKTTYSENIENSLVIDTSTDDPTGEVAGDEDTITTDGFHSDCGDLCIGESIESTTELMELCKDALSRFEWLEDSASKDTRLRFAHSLTYYTQRIGEYVIRNMIDSGVTSERLEVKR